MMGLDVVAADRRTVGGVVFELYRTADGSQGVFRMIDEDHPEEAIHISRGQFATIQANYEREHGKAEKMEAS